MMLSPKDLYMVVRLSRIRAALAANDALETAPRVPRCRRRRMRAGPLVHVGLDVAERCREHAHVPGVERDARPRRGDVDQLLERRRNTNGHLLLLAVAPGVVGDG